MNLCGIIFIPRVDSGGNAVDAPPRSTERSDLPMQPQCTTPECFLSPCNARGWCWKHYARWRRYGSPTGQPPKIDTATRFYSKFEVGPADSCWPWQGTTIPSGYGQFHVATNGGRALRVMAHRASYELAFGPIPNGLTIDHLCRNVSCVNPHHLEAVSIKVNILRGTAPSARRARQTHCKRGHLFSPENTYIYPPTGHRTCRRCRRV